MSGTRKVPWSLVLLILIATALRLFQLGAQDIWGDEAFSIALSLKPLSQVIAGGADTHPPLYPVLLWAWMHFGLPVGQAGAFFTRSLSVLFGIAAVPLTFVFAKRFYGARTARFAALLAAISPLLVYYSQETRMYELVAVLSLASAYFMTRGRRTLAAYFIVTLAALYTHYSGFFVLAAENVFFLLRYWTRRRVDSLSLAQWVFVQGALLVGYIPWIVVQSSFLSAKASTRLDEWSWRGVEMVFGKTLLAFSAGLTTAFPVVQIAGALFLALAIAGTVSLFRLKNVSYLPPLCFGVPVLVAWLVDPVMPFFFERYVLVALPAFYVTVGLGLDYVSRRSRALSVTLTGVLVLFSAFALANYFFDDAYAKGKYGEMMVYVQQRVQPGDALVLNNPLQKPLFDYYGPRDLPAYYLPDGSTPLEDPASRARLAEIARTHSRVWLVMFGNPAEYDPTGYLERWLGANAFKTESRGFVDASLDLYVMPGASPSAVRGSMGVKLGENAGVGAIRLLGYDLDRAELVPGQTLRLTLHWQATAPLAKSLKVFTHLVGAINPVNASPVWAQMDSEPAGGSRPTTGWQVGETIDDLYGLELPASAAPGDYFLEVGMYDPQTLVRLPVWDEQGNRVPDDRVILTTVKVIVR